MATTIIKATNPPVSISCCPFSVIKLFLINCGENCSQQSYNGTYNRSNYSKPPKHKSSISQLKATQKILNSWNLHL